MSPTEPAPAPPNLPPIPAPRVRTPEPVPTPVAESPPPEQVSTEPEDPEMTQLPFGYVMPELEPYVPIHEPEFEPGSAPDTDEQESDSMIIGEAQPEPTAKDYPVVAALTNEPESPPNGFVRDLIRFSRRSAFLASFLGDLGY